jgi:hypothetical protein
VRVESHGLDFRKILKYQISGKSMHWELSCSMRTDGRTDVTKLIVAFRNFENAPKNASRLRKTQSLKALVCSGRLKNRVSDLHARRSNTSFKRNERIPTLWEFRCNKQRTGSAPMPVYIYRHFILDSELHRNVQEIYDLPLIPLRIQSD